MLRKKSHFDNVNMQVIGKKCMLTLTGMLTCKKIHVQVIS